MEALYIAAGALLLAAAVWMFLIFPRRSRRRETKRFVRDYAHRGLHGGEIPENTLAAFDKAASAGFGIELDVQLTRDGEVVVLHDYDTGRMCGEKRRVSASTLAELKALRIGDTDNRIPTLREALDTVAGRVPLLIELKGETTDTSLCASLHGLLAGYSGAYCVESFNPLLLKAFASREPSAVRGLLVCRMNRTGFANKPLGFALERLLLCFLCRPDFLACRCDEPLSLSARICRALGTPLLLWTPRGEAERAGAAKKCDGIIFEQGEQK